MKNKKYTVCLYLQYPSFYEASGIGKAIKHQAKALELNKINQTFNKKDDYDILHINSQIPTILWTIKKAKKQGKKIVLHAHMTSKDFRNSVILSNWMAPLIHWWLNILYSKGDVIITPSSYTKNLLKKNYSRLGDKKIIPLSNGVDINKWNPDKVRAEKFKKDFGFKSPLIFSVGLVFLRKGILDFIKTARELKNFNFMWVGKFMSKFLIGNRELRKELKNLPDNMKFTGFVNDIIGVYSAGDIFFFPSHEENEGIVILEAAAMQKAIIVRDIPVFCSYLKEGENCLIGKTNEDFEKAIKELVEDKNLRNKLAKNARRLAESKSLENIGKELGRVYESLIDTH